MVLEGLLPGNYYIVYKVFNTLTLIKKRLVEGLEQGIQISKDFLNIRFYEMKLSAMKINLELKKLNIG